MNKNCTTVNLKLLLDWTLDAKHALFVEGKKRGFYADQGIDLEILEPAQKSSLALELLYRGEADIVINYPHNIILMQKDLPGVISAGSLVQINPEGLLSLEDKGIKKPKDLVGKRIGVGPSPVSRGQLEVFLKNQGIKEEEVSLLIVGFEGEKLLLEGSIDALDAVSYAIPRTLRKGHKVNFLSYTEYGLPDSPFLVFAVREEWLQKNRKTFKEFLAATKKSLPYIEKWTEKDWADYVRDLPGGKSGPEEKEVWERTYTLLKAEKLFHLDLNALGKLQDILMEKGILEKPYDLSKLFVNESPA